MAKTIVKNTVSRRVRNVKRANIYSGIFSSFFYGIFRGIGMAAGFSGIAAILIFVIRYLPLHKIPVIGDIIMAIINSK